MQADASEPGWSNRAFTVATHDSSGNASAASRPLRIRFAPAAVATIGRVRHFPGGTRNALEERAQQLKLAAMGRLTASIAHEIRNPLAAISNTSQLLAEDAAEFDANSPLASVRENTSPAESAGELRVARRESLTATSLLCATLSKPGPSSCA